MVIWGTLLQRRVPPHLLGRVSSLDFFVSLALMPVSMAVAGPVGEWIGIPMTFVLAGAVPVFLAVAAILAWRLPADEIAHPLDPAPAAPELAVDDHHAASWPRSGTAHVEGVAEIAMARATVRQPVEGARPPLAEGHLGSAAAAPAVGGCPVPDQQGRPHLGHLGQLPAAGPARVLVHISPLIGPCRSMSRPTV